MANIILLIGLLTLLIELVGLFFVKKRDRMWVYFLMLFTVIIFFTAFYYKSIA